MRLTITLQPLKGEKAPLPLQYNYPLQSFIYHHISLKLADFLHNRGYSYGKRRFKLFTFSRINGRFQVQREKEKIVFTGPIHFHISSPVKEFIEQFAEDLARVPEVSINSNSFVITSIEVHFQPGISGSLIIKMLSPVTVYSTLSTADGRKKTYYYSPFEDEFSRLIQNNLIKKYQAFYGNFPTATDFEICPLGVTKSAEKIIKYKPKDASYTLIKGWMGHYQLQGNPELISLAYDTGLGSKNPQGFGMFEIMN